MLVLRRRPGEKIRIGNDIVIEVLEIKGRQVRIGINAPDRISVLREEVFLKIEQENRQAAQSPVDLTILEDLPVVE